MAAASRAINISRTPSVFLTYGTPNDVRHFPSSSGSGSSSSNGHATTASTPCQEQQQQPRSQSIPISQSQTLDDGFTEEAAMAEYREYAMLRRIQQGQRERLQRAREYALASKGVAERQHPTSLAELTFQAHQQPFLHTMEEPSIPTSILRPQMIYSHSYVNDATAEDRSDSIILPACEDDDDEDEGVFELDL